MVSLEIFVVFHKQLFDECYAELTPEEFKYLTFIAVNEKIPKLYDRSKYTKVINEWELKNYDPYYQNNRYNENSVLKHMVDNGIVNTEYVGFVQYDMKFPKDSINQIIGMLSAKRCLAVMPSTFHFAFIQSCAPHELNAIMSIPSHYERFVGRQSNNMRMFPLLNSFIVHSSVFSESLKFFVHMLGVFNPSHGNMGGIFERVNAYAFSQNCDEVVSCPIVDMHHSLKAKAY